MVKFIILVVLFYTSVLHAQNDDLAVFVDAGDNQGLINAIENANTGSGPSLIFIRPGQDGENTFTFSEGYKGSENALPVLNMNRRISIFPIDSSATRIKFERSPEAPPIRLFETLGTGELELGVLIIEGFSSDNNGGAILAGGTSRVSLIGTIFRNNFATNEGGAIYMGDDSRLFARGTGRISSNGPGEFSENRAANLGGAISINGNAIASITHQLFTDNGAGVFGCDINVNSSSNANFGLTLVVENNTFAANCDNVLFENPRGRMLFRNNTFAGMGDVADSTDTVNLFGNLFGGFATNNNKSQPPGGLKALCNDFGSNAFNSLGHNISNESSCDLDQSTDLPNTDPMINSIDVNGVISLQVGSPAIDAGASDMQDNADGLDFLPCGYIDSRGLGRPQDANGDGVFECDMGSYEVQGGPDLTAAQSGLYFDTGRDGEGIHVEMLNNDTALVAMFTYHPNGTDLMWFVGSGNRVGNSVVIDDMYRASGGAFGPGFDADQVDFEVVGSLSLVFPNCAATDKPGRMVLASNQRIDQPVENLLVEAFTLSRLLNCSQTQSSAKTGRSGSFFDPQRNGEGLFIDVIDDDTAVVFFYTFTPTGEQLWLVGSGASITGDTITANMLYPTSTTGFGSGFDANEIQFSSWGNMSITHQAGCNNLLINYNSTVPGYGTGSLNHSRLTQPAGTTCDL